MHRSPRMVIDLLEQISKTLTEANYQRSVSVGRVISMSCDDETACLIRAHQRTKRYVTIIPRGLRIAFESDAYNL